MIEYFTEEMQEMFDGINGIEPRLRLDVAISDLEDIYKENYPFQTIETINGPMFIFTRSFIYKCLWAMATDSMQDMGEEEEKWFLKFMKFEDVMSTNPPPTTNLTDTLGCTVKDKLGKSYVVLADLSVTTIECVNPIDLVEDIDVLVELDNVFVDMLDMNPINRDKIPTGELIDVTQSALDKIKDIIK